jgi:hypothetical protein
MKAAYYRDYGAAREVFEVGELPDPEPGPGEVRVKIGYSGVNPSDCNRRSGRRDRPGYPLIIPHSDGAGEIDKVGAGVEAARIGERVWTWNAQRGRPFGTAADFVCLPSAQAVPMPAGVDLELGAGFGVPAMTAYFSLFSDGPLAGRDVLVTGAAGAVGLYAAQFAHLAGARTLVATVSGDAKAEIARAAGARNQDIHGCRPNFCQQSHACTLSRVKFQGRMPKIVVNGRHAGSRSVRTAFCRDRKVGDDEARIGAEIGRLDARAIALCFRLQLRAACWNRWKRRTLRWFWERWTSHWRARAHLQLLVDGEAEDVVTA